MRATPWSARLVGLCLALVAACDDASSTPADAGGLDAFFEEACTSARPGIRVQLTVTSPAGLGWMFDEKVFRMTVGAASRAYEVPDTFLGPDRRTGTVALRYPDGAVAGPATLDFYRLGPGVCDQVGQASFAADPAVACTDVALTVSERCPFDDAGVD
jgi:hypothetical protein